MASVVQRIKEIKQPRGGYLHPKFFAQHQFSDGIILHTESISPVTAGLVVDYLFRTTLSKSKLQIIFEPSLLGAQIGGYRLRAEQLISEIVGLDERSIIAAAKLTGYDQIYRAGFIPPSDPSQTINPNSQDIENILTMVDRTSKFFTSFEPVTVDSFTFMSDSIQRSGFTSSITAGDGDVLTAEGLWDLKVSVKGPTSIHTLQILIYHLMGLRSFHADGTPLYDGNFQNVKHLGIFNPRLNTAYTIEVADIPKEVIREVETLVIGYQ